MRYLHQIWPYFGVLFLFIACAPDQSTCEATCDRLVQLGGAHCAAAIFENIFNSSDCRSRCKDARDNDSDACKEARLSLDLCVSDNAETICGAKTSSVTPVNGPYSAFETLCAPELKQGRGVCANP